MNTLHRPFQPTLEPAAVPKYLRWVKHPVFCLLGLRPTFAQHTVAEGEALHRWAQGRMSLVEIGVAEGASALVLRGAMNPEGVLYLIDPYHLGRIPLLHSVKRVARRTVSRSNNGRVVWVERFSFDAVLTWTTPVDFLFFDGDHSTNGIQEDWRSWNSHLLPGGVAAFHDARTFSGGWTRPEDGPVQLANALFRATAQSPWQIVEEVDSLVVVRKAENV